MWLGNAEPVPLTDAPIQRMPVDPPVAREYVPMMQERKAGHPECAACSQLGHWCELHEGFKVDALGGVPG